MELISKVQKNVGRAYMKAWLIFVTLMNTPIALCSAKTGEDAVNDIMNAEGNDTFDKATKTAKEVEASGFSLYYAIAAAVLVISLIVFGLHTQLHAGNPQKAAEAKDKGIDFVTGACLTFGSISIAAIIVGFAKGIK